jgi:hypothetical protein
MYFQQRMLSCVFVLTVFFVLSRSSIASAFFKVPCAQPVVVSRLDPVVQPGQQSAHGSHPPSHSNLKYVHTVMGSSGFSMSSTYGSLFDGSCTTCQLSVDKSAYWVPSLYYVSKDSKNFSSVTQNGGSLMYYLFRRHNDQIPLVSYPEGFRMVTGVPISQ